MPDRFAIFKYPYLCHNKRTTTNFDNLFLRLNFLTFQPAIILVVDGILQFPIEVAAECLMTSSIARAISPDHYGHRTRQW